MSTEAERTEFIRDRWWHWGPFSRVDVPYKGFYETTYYFRDLIRISFKRRYKQ